MLLAPFTRRLGRLIKPGSTSACNSFRSLCSIVHEPESAAATSPYPGAKNVPITTNLAFFGGPRNVEPIPVPIPCFQTMTATGEKVEGVDGVQILDSETAVEIYKAMVKLQTVDVLFYEAQRQVMIKFGSGVGMWEMIRCQDNMLS